MDGAEADGHERAAAPREAGQRAVPMTGSGVGIGEML